MSRDSKLYLQDMLNACDHVIDFSHELTRADLDTEELRLHAILYNIQVLGEAAKNIPSDMREQHPEIAWRGTTSMRDVLVHKYFQIDLDLLWEVIHDKIPALREQLAPLLRED